MTIKEGEGPLIPWVGAHPIAGANKTFQLFVKPVLCRAVRKDLASGGELGENGVNDIEGGRGIVTLKTTNA